MRCPKCRYISFEAGDRCRNCGYEFSLTVDVKGLDLPIQTGDEPKGPLAELSLSDLDKDDASAPPAPPRKAARGFDLPLFKDRRGADDAPLVTPPAVPRAPLAVRKSSPAIARAVQRQRAEEPELDLQPAEEAAADPRDAPAPPSAAPAADPAALITAPLFRRFAAVTIDLFILGAIDAAVLYFTMRLCGLQLFEIGIIPIVPFGSFIAMLNGGYFVAFVAAGGQTIGKMTLDIKVVPGDAVDPWSDRVSIRAAVVRAVGWLMSVLPAGLGLVPAFFSAERRTLHDRLADTRVVRA